MQTSNIEVDRDEARRMWQKYLTHKHTRSDMDAEIERIYKVIAGGKLVIRALESITAAGVDVFGLPKLAIIRADAQQCFCTLYSDGSGFMADQQWTDRRMAQSRYVKFDKGAFVRQPQHRTSGVAVVPHIPPDIRPRRGLQNYHILFEAVWTKVPPVDPLLLRRIGKGDTWMVVGAWDLTDVERAAMAARL